MTDVLNNIKLPPILYKYRDWNNPYHKNIILKREIFLANPYSFNDLFDCKILTRWDLLTQEDYDRKNKALIDSLGENLNEEEKKAFAKRLRESGMWYEKKNMRMGGKEYLDKIDEISGIISLSSKSDNILMWSHYAANHTGFCIGLCTETIRKMGEFDYIGKVSYSREYPIISGNYEVEKRFYLEVFSKSLDWEYEDEYRISKRNFISRVVKLPSNIFKEIIIGCNTLPEDQKSIIENARKNLPKIKIFKAQRREYEFGLNFVEV